MLELIGIALTHMGQKDYIMRLAERLSRKVQECSYYGMAQRTDGGYDIFWKGGRE